MAEAVPEKRCPCPDHEGPNPLPPDAFGKDASRPDGLFSWCKACHCRYEAKRRVRKREVLPAGMRRCTFPEHEGPNPLPESEFHRTRLQRDGRTWSLNSWCKVCMGTFNARRSRERRANPPPLPADYRKRCRCPEHQGPNPLPAGEFPRQGSTADGLSGWCKACARRVMLRQRKAANAASLDTAHRRGQPWTGPELEIAARKDLSPAQVAAMTGRTIFAVGNMRQALRDDPKTIAHAGLDDPADAMIPPGMTFGPAPDSGQQKRRKGRPQDPPATGPRRSYSSSSPA